MSVAAFMLPSYGSMDPYSSHYQSSYQTGGAYVGGESHGVPHSSPPASTFAPAYTASPPLMNTSPRVNQQATESRPQRGSSYPGSYHSAGASPYLTPQSPPPPAYGMSNPAPHVAQFSSQSPNLHSHDIAPTTYAPAYPIQPSAYSSAPYEPGYHSIAGTPPGYGGVQPASSYMGGQGYGIPNSTEHATANGEDSGVRILNARPKPQCWDHGCNGRQFSTFSNLLRHQREKSGTAAKSVCPRCGAEFTRTTARNGHMAHDKCKRKSTTSPSGTD